MVSLISRGRPPFASCPDAAGQWMSNILSIFPCSPNVVCHLLVRGDIDALAVRCVARRDTAFLNDSLDFCFSVSLAVSQLLSCVTSDFRRFLSASMRFPLRLSAVKCGSTESWTCAT